MRRLVKVSLILSLAVFGLLGTSGLALADKPEGPVGPGNGVFLCPVVGDGVLNADAHNGDNGVSAISPPVGTSFLPGNNQAGAHANDNALADGGPGSGAGPGHNPNFSPIWDIR